MLRNISRGFSSRGCLSHFLMLAVCAAGAFAAMAWGPAAGRAFAQEAATRQTPPAYRGVEMRVGGVFVTPVPNVPLTAVAEIESTQTLDDGSTVSKKTIDNIARDSQGRIYNERREMVAEDFQGVPPLMSGHIYDPTTQLNTFMDPSTKLARQSIFLARRKTATASAGRRRAGEFARGAGAGSGYAVDGGCGGARAARTRARFRRRPAGLGNRWWSPMRFGIRTSCI